MLRMLHRLFPFNERHPVDVSVIIPCHNYGCYLSGAIESVLRQTVHPQEILVVDDASSDDTKDVALSYANRGITYLRAEHRDLSATRNTGTKSTKGSFLLFLDADDMLAEDFIEQCLAVCSDAGVSFAYGDVQKFGEQDLFRRTPDFDPALLSRSNYICSHVLVRRSAFEAVGGYRCIPHAMEDWEFYRRLVAAGFVGKRAETKSFYRIHSDSMLQTHKAGPHFTYCNDAALFFRPITIGTICTGTMDVLDRTIDGLRSLDFDPAMIHLHCVNLSKDPACDALLRSKIETLPFFSTQITCPSRERADCSFEDAYAELIRQCTTDYLLMLGESVVLRPMSLKTLLETMRPSIVAVAAPLAGSRIGTFESWKLCDEESVEYAEIRGVGHERVDGAGLDCTLFRIHPLKALMPLASECFHGRQMSFQESLFLRLRPYGQVFCNWDVLTETASDS